MRSVAIAVALVLVASAADTAGAARPVTLTLRVASYPLVCGRVDGSLAIALPAAVQLPQRIAADSVRLNGRAAARVSVAGRQVTVTALRPNQVICQSIVLGRLTVVFTPAADIGGTPGAYAASVRRGTRDYRARLTITA